MDSLNAIENSLRSKEQPLDGTAMKANATGKPKPLKSCLKRHPLQEIGQSTSAAGKKKKVVGFILPPSYFTRVKPAMEKPKETPVDLGIALADLSKAAYLELCKLFHPTFHYQGNIKLNFQPGITRDYIEYLMTHDWPKEELTGEEQDLRNAATAVVVRYLSVADLSNLEIADETKCLIVVERADIEAIEFVFETYSQHLQLRFLMLSDVWTLLELAANDKLAAKLSKVLLFGVTHYDMLRDKKYRYLPGPYPCMLEANFDDNCLKVWQTTSRARSIFHKLFVWSLQSYPVSEEYEIKSAPLKYLAPACGFFLVHNSTVNTHSQSMDNILIDNSLTAADSSRLFLPQALEFLYKKEHPGATLVPKEIGTKWKFMEEAIAKSFSRPHHIEDATFGQRCEFLRTSFVANRKHTMVETIYGPAMSTAEKIGFFNPAGILECERLHPHFWPVLLAALHETRIVLARDLSHGPDVYAKLVDNSDPSKPVSNLVCFQSKHGKQDLSLLNVLDELAKCPFVSIVEKRGKRKLAFESTQNSQKGEPVNYRLTFVYVAMTHTYVCSQIRQQNLFDEIKPDYIRCTNARCPSIPENVELIVLRKKGLIDLFGQEIAVLTEHSGSTHEETVRREIQNFIGQYKHFRVELLKLGPKDPNESTICFSDSGSDTKGSITNIQDIEERKEDIEEQQEKEEQKSPPTLSVPKSRKAGTARKTTVSRPKTSTPRPLVKPAIKEKQLSVPTPSTPNPKATPASEAQKDPNKGSPDSVSSLDMDMLSNSSDERKSPEKSECTEEKELAAIPIDLNTLPAGESDPNLLTKPQTSERSDESQLIKPATKLPEPEKSRIPKYSTPKKPANTPSNTNVRPPVPPITVAPQSARKVAATGKTTTGSTLFRTPVKTPGPKKATTKVPPPTLAAKKQFTAATAKGTKSNTNDERK